MLDNNYALSPTTDKTAEVHSQFLDNYDQELSVPVGISYTAAKVIIQAVEEAGSTNPDDINEAPMRLSYEDHTSAMGTVRFDGRGENVSTLGPMNQVQNLSVRVVYPKEYAGVRPQV